MTDSELKALWEKNEAAAALARKGQVPPGWATVEQARADTARNRRLYLQDWDEIVRRKISGKPTDDTRLAAVRAIVDASILLPLGYRVRYEQREGEDRDGQRWAFHWDLTAIYAGPGDVPDLAQWNKVVARANAELRATVDYIDWRKSRAGWWQQPLDDPFTGIDVDELDDQEDDDDPFDWDGRAPTPDEVEQYRAERARDPMTIAPLSEPPGDWRPSVTWAVDVEVWSGPR